MMGQTDGQTHTRPLHISCSAYYASSVNNTNTNPKQHPKTEADARDGIFQRADVRTRRRSLDQNTALSTACICLGLIPA